MGHETFTYQTRKDGVLRIFWEGCCVMTLGGNRGQKLSDKLAATELEAEVQALLQRATGNFKRGNERRNQRQK